MIKGKPKMKIITEKKHLVCLDLIYGNVSI